MQGHDQGLLGEVQGIGRGQRRQQAPLMLQVVEQDHFLVATGRSELPARRSVVDRDRERQLRRAEGGPGDADTARHQRAQHGEEAPRFVGDRTAIGPVRRDAAKAIQ